MSCSIGKFIINKGIDNEFVLTIKQTGTTLPMEIMGSDTFTAYLIRLVDDVVVLTLTEGSGIEAAANPNGKITINISQEQADTLVSEKGSKVDRYYLLPTYRLMVDCNTVNNGAFIAKVPEVYVE